MLPRGDQSPGISDRDIPVAGPERDRRREVCRVHFNTEYYRTARPEPIPSALLPRSTGRILDEAAELGGHPGSFRATMANCRSPVSYRDLKRPTRTLCHPQKSA